MRLHAYCVPDGANVILLVWRMQVVQHHQRHGGVPLPYERRAAECVHTPMRIRPVTRQSVRHGRGWYPGPSWDCPGCPPLPVHVRVILGAPRLARLCTPPSSSHPSPTSVPQGGLRGACGAVTAHQMPVAAWPRMVKRSESWALSLGFMAYVLGMQPPECFLSIHPSIHPPTHTPPPQPPPPPRKF